MVAKLERYARSKRGFLAFLAVMLLAFVGRDVALAKSSESAVGANSNVVNSDRVMKLFKVQSPDFEWRSLGVDAAYSQAPYYSQTPYYSQVTYYSQTPYYSQSTYQTTFTKDATMTGGFAISGAVSKGSGTFVIDHPLDPKNKLLYHSFVESPDVKNVYDGTAVLDGNGNATITLPDYFMALNTDFRYQLKPMGAPMPHLHIAQEIKDNVFSVAGGVSGGKVSWQVTGTRHDPYILANPIIPVVEKGPNALVKKGEYLFDGNIPKKDLFSTIKTSVKAFIEELWK